MEKVPRPERLRQSMLAQLNNCSHAGYLYLKHGSGLQAHPLNRGTLFHETVEACTTMALMKGEDFVSGDVARDVAQQVIKQHPELPIPHHEQEAVRLMAWNWGESTRFDPGAVLLLEEQLELELDGWTLYGTPDLVEMVGDGIVRITDYKTSLTVPSQEAYEKDFQAPFYALLVSEGKYADSGQRFQSGLRAVQTRQVYPRYREYDGSLRERRVDFTQEQIADFAVAVESVVARLDHGLESNDWPAVPGPHCARCPKPSECPILEHLPQPPLASPQEAAEAAEKWLLLDQERRDLFFALRAYASDNGEIEFGAGQKLGFKVVEQKGRTTTRFGLV